MRDNSPATLGTLRLQVASAFVSRGRVLQQAEVFFRGIFLAGGALVAGVAQFVTWPSNTAPAPAQIVGISGCVVIFFAAIREIWFGQKDASEQLALAQEAIARAEERVRVAEQHADDQRARLLELIEELPDIDKTIALYQCTKRMRDALEEACTARVNDEDRLVASLTKIDERMLAVAAGFTLVDQYTICVYKAVQRTGEAGNVLRLIEHVRTIDCSKDTAREWPEGRGVAGVAFSSSKEIIIEDLLDDDVLAVFQPDELTRGYDADRYRSMIAVPISVRGADQPWGVVTATSDRLGHFSHEDEPGRKPEEAARVLARYCELAITITRSNGDGIAAAPMVN